LATQSAAAKKGPHLSGISRRGVFATTYRTKFHDALSAKGALTMAPLFITSKGATS